MIIIKNFIKYSDDKIEGKNFTKILYNRLLLDLAGSDTTEISITTNKIDTIKELVPLPRGKGSHLCEKSRALVSRCVESVGKNDAMKILGLTNKSVDKALQHAPPPIIKLPSCQLKEQQEDLTFPDGRLAKGRMKYCVKLAHRVPEEIRELLLLKTFEHFSTSIPIHVRQFKLEIQQSVLEEYAMVWNVSDTSFWRFMKGMGFHFKLLKQKPDIFLKLELVEWRHIYLKAIKDYRQNGMHVYA